MVEFTQNKSSLSPDGHREKIRVADVNGSFTKARRAVFFILIAVYAILPWLSVGGQPIIFFDILHRRFFLFGQTFNAQDAYMVFFLVSGGAFLLFYLTALAGRIWCGWACPQTVFLEGVFRRIDRWLEDPKHDQVILSTRKWDLFKIKKFILKHALYLLCALIVSHIFISYFVRLDDLFRYVRSSPIEHWDVFVWMTAITAVIYFNFAWFREQLCLIVCPYGKLQSVLTDDDTLVIGYDEKRGEPRGKKSDANRGACINCNRCVEVCPTGIDIRNGLQLECIGCANCIDACNDIMLKINQPLGLIRYDSLNGLTGGVRKILRPRLYLYTVLLLLGVGVFSIFLKNHKPFEATVLRLSGAPYVLQEGVVRNQYLLHVVNKTPSENKFNVLVSLPPEARLIDPVKEINLKSFEDRKIPLFVEIPRDRFTYEFSVEVTTSLSGSNLAVISSIPFLGPVSSPHSFQPKISN